MLILHLGQLVKGREILLHLLLLKLKESDKGSTSNQLQPYRPACPQVFARMDALLGYDNRW